ncbi:FeS cluster assembly protein sufB [Escherichia coli KTE139]|nr:FeS cluster assembly protein sufB [Escherichia coli KTE211]ELI85793.1 FeS cluster assembly protein sufB [Escherichia coli KTE139]
MSRNTEATDDVKTWTGGPLNYKEGFFTQLATDELAKGINEEVVRAISAKRNEPEWMLEFRLNAYHAWLEMEEPGNDSNLLIVFYVQIMPDDLVMQLHRF